MKNNKTVTICSSATFYLEVIEIEKKLKKLGFRVKIPVTARKMEKSGNFNVETRKPWINDPKLYHLKKKLMDGHFKKVMEADVILVVNDTKNGIEGYIGGNVLMEITLAYYNNKPIYLYRELSDKSSIYEEVMGIGAVTINEDLMKIA